ncbi:type IV-A pilus assembly ATPase PilB [Vibrio sp. CAIM 722]|uniref:Type IV-A pilus assembly ATPase PilB n=1 Tax=Vibrio eleionomae TaxID=2653505 RepID=A0A7X4RTT8_9VIBR|nr:ATPase, T2SS/T4P/T4SS family [Vibrio eleionomae]MZI92542.1 type IV-A pilus assembly ATPase PilB [Vibrio eleionomae]
MSHLIPLLSHHQLLTAEQAKNAQQVKKNKNISAIDALLQSQFLTSKVIQQFLSHQLKLPTVELSYIAPIIDEIALPMALLRHYQIIPIEQSVSHIIMAVSDPTQEQLQQECQLATGKQIQLQVADHHQLKALLKQYVPSATDSSNTIQEQRLLYLMEETESPEQEEAAGTSSPIAQSIDELLITAFEQHASDIHFEPHQHHYRIRFRRDGLLSEHLSLPIKLHRRFVARLKIMAHMDIAERRRPQDGRILFTLPDKKALDLRLSTLPTQWGEKVVIRLLATEQQQLSLSLLGMTAEQQQIYFNALQNPQGFILVTGPTGSGKTQTLYTGLNSLDRHTLNISTVEDPIEITLDNINQVAVNPAIELNFTQVLRALLRQDPDVLMVGEIRDTETARIAIKAAQTGHLVLSTLHTNSAVETLIRLHHIGIENYHISASLTLIIAQRLIRKLCPECKQPHAPTPTESQWLNIEPSISIFTANSQGCSKCHMGYQGRIGIYELLPVSPEIQSLLLINASQQQLEQQATAQGIMTLKSSAAALVIQGISSIAECRRVLAMQESLL